MDTATIHALDNDALLGAVTTTVQQANGLMVHLLRLLIEVEDRRLFARLGFPSMFAFVTGRLGLSESAAYKRIHAARAARSHPSILDLLARGRLHLSAIGQLTPHLTQANAGDLLQAAQGKSKEALQALLAARFAQQVPRSRLRRLPSVKPVGLSTQTPGSASLGAPESLPASSLSAPATATDSPGQPRRDAIPSAGSAGGASGAAAAQSAAGDPAAPPPAHRTPLLATAPAPAAPSPTPAVAYRLQVTLDAEAHAALRTLQALLGPQANSYDLDAVIKAALLTTRDKLLQRRHALRQTDLPLASVLQSVSASEAPSEVSPLPPAAPGETHSPAPSEVSPLPLAAPGETHSPAPSEPYQRHTSQAVPAPRLPAAPALSPASARLYARTPSPASPSPARSRYLPAELKRSVYLRDGGRCVFRAPDGTRCPSRDVEYHHIIPYACGGQHSLQNIALACKGHNQLQADIDYGRAHQERFRRPDRLISAELSPERAALQLNRDGCVGSEHATSASP